MSDGPWRGSLAEHVARVAKHVEGDAGTNRLHFETASLQARIAYEAGQSQERIGRALVTATNRLAVATLALVAVTVVLVVVTLVRG